MYYYIVDPGGLPVEKFEKLHIELQSYLTEFKIAGEIARVTPLRTIADLLDTASQRGATTVIACGSDSTFNLALAALKGRDFTLGFIPFVPDSYLAPILGIESIFHGAKTIAARRIEKIDLARVGSSYFISYVEFGILSRNLQQAGFWSMVRTLSAGAKAFSIRIDDSYTVNINALGGLAVNIRSTSKNSEKIANPTDSVLDLLILEKLSKLEILRYKHSIASGCLENVPKTTVIKCKKMQFLEPRGAHLTMMGRTVAKFPATVELVPQRLRVIVGKNRTF